jgi:uncharacterized peroxidase-related enzyme
MSRIPTPATIGEAPAEARALLENVEKLLGSVPNLFRIVANSPAALEGLLGLSGALRKGEIDAATGERIALAIANINGCTYCNSAHTYLGANLAKLDEAELAANRAGRSTDPRADAAVRLAAAVARERGHVGEDEIRNARLAGYSDAAIVEIIAHVAVNVFTNYVNEALGTEVDFPVVQLKAA